MDPSTIMALLQLAVTAYSAANQPKPPGNTQTAQPAGGGTQRAESVFGAGQQTRTSGPPQTVDPQSFSPTGIGQTLMMGTQQPQLPGIYDESQGPAKPLVQQPPKKKEPGIGDVLSQAPEALAAIAPLLMNQPQRPQALVIGAQGGGQGGSMVPGFNLPKRTTIGELLNSLPRPRYG